MKSLSNVKSGICLSIPLRRVLKGMCGLISLFYNLDIYTGAQCLRPPLKSVALRVMGFDRVICITDIFIWSMNASGLKNLRRVMFGVGGC